MGPIYGLFYVLKNKVQRMHHLIKDLAILLLVSLPINIVFHKIKIPSVMGFFAGGSHHWSEWPAIDRGPGKGQAVGGDRRGNK